MVVEVAANPIVLRNAANRQMSYVDRVRVALQKSGEQEVHFNLADFATSIDMDTSNLYRSLYQLARRKELEFLHRPSDIGGKPRIAGVKLIKLESADHVLRRSIEKPVNTDRVVRKIMNMAPDQYPNLTEYRHKKEAVDRIRMELHEAGFDPDQVLQLPAENIIAEEGVNALNELLDAYRKIAELEIKCNLLERTKTPEPA